jgi:hypothetical protein
LFLRYSLRLVSLSPIKQRVTENQAQKIIWLYEIFGAIMGWLAVILQFYLILQNPSSSALATSIRFISYFTIQVNILVAICFTSLAWKKRGDGSGFFSRTSTRTALAVYIVIVGAVYNIVLRSIWDPKGLQRIVDESLHSIVPVLYTVYWLIFVPKDNLHWKNVFAWAIFPFLYLIYILVRGAIVQEYPYPFVDVSELGYPRVLINSALLLLIFFGVSLLFIAIPKLIGRRRTKDLSIKK